MSARDRVQRLAAPLLVAVAAAALPGVAAQAQTSPSAHTSAIRYDAMNRVTGAIAPDPDGAGPLKFAATRTTYNSVGLPTKVETGELAGWHSEAVAPASWPTAAASPSTGFTVLSSVETSYDIVYRKAKVVTKGSDGIATGVVQYSYDAVGRLECTAVRMNPATYASLPASACTLGTEGSFGPDRITRNVYDAAGQLLKVQKAYGTPLAEDYVTYTYTLNGKQATVTDAKGHVATYAYDGFDRLAAWRFPSKATGTVSAPCTIGTIAETAGVTGPSQARTAGDDCEKYGYDRNGSRAFLVKRDGSVLTYQYDALGRMTAKIVPDRPDLGANHVRDVYYSYDLRGLQTAARYDSPTGDGLTFTYDGFGRQTGSTIALYGSSYSLANVYDRHGNRTRLTHPDGTHVDYAYDGLDRAATITQGATTIAGLAYNNRGARAALSQGVTTSYGYDNVGRPNALGHDLSGSPHDVTYGYAYTPASQLASQSRNNDAYAWTGHFNIDRNYTVNGLNQYTSAGSANFCYDDNGNLTADGATVYQYDVENRLVQVRTQVNSDCAALSLAGTQLAIMRYDPLGRLHMWGGTATPARKTVYDGDALVAEYGGTGALTVMARYIHGPGVDEPLAWYDGASVATTALRRLRADHQGSVVAVADNAGAMVAINSYDEYGIPAAGNQGRFQYTGQAWIPDIGMYYYKARIYSPTLGRFLQTDPIGYKDQVNLYAYVGSDPINRIDPSGKSDLNLFSSTDKLYLAGWAFEPSGEDTNIFTISAHGNPAGVQDNRDHSANRGEMLGTSQLLSLAREYGYKPHMTLFLAACNCAREGFARNLARESGGSVIAANGFTMFPSAEKGYRPNMASPVSLYVSMTRDPNGPRGEFIRYNASGMVVDTYNKATYNPSTGRVIFTGDAPTGSRIIRSHEQCVSKELCSAKE